MALDGYLYQESVIGRLWTRARYPEAMVDAVAPCRLLRELSRLWLVSIQKLVLKKCLRGNCQFSKSA